MVETSELLRYEDDYKDLHPAPHEFFHCELASALQEQMFGISDALITNSGGFGATAVVEVLEGDKYAVVLTRQGFEVKMRDTGVHLTFETLDGLLQTISPKYTRKCMEMLDRRLLEMLENCQKSYHATEL